MSYSGFSSAVDFFRTDLGREFNFIRIPKLDELIGIAPDDTIQDLFISGVVTGARVENRTIRRRGRRASQRLT